MQKRRQKETESKPKRIVSLKITSCCPATNKTPHGETDTLKQIVFTHRRESNSKILNYRDNHAHIRLNSKQPTLCNLPR